MAKHVKNILDIILTPEFKDIIDSSGNVPVPSSAVYTRICNLLKEFNNESSAVKPSYLYVFLHENRYGILDEIIKYHNIEINPDNSILSQSSFNSAGDDSINNNSVKTFSLTLSYNTWSKIAPESVMYADRALAERQYTTLVRKVWTDELYEKIYSETKLPCALNFKRCKMSGTGIYLTVFAECPECNCIFKGCVVNKPVKETDIRLECAIENFDGSIMHKKKRQLKGKRRIDVSKEMVDSNFLPCIWRRTEANKLMKFGDREPAHLPSIQVLKKAKQERRDINLGIQSDDPILSIQQMKYGKHIGSIHSVGCDPFFVHYWTQQQMTVYKKHPDFLSIDATGSLVKKLKLMSGELSSHIYLYEVVTETPSYKMPVFQMLSAAHNTNAISYWLKEIIRIGQSMQQSFPTPKKLLAISTKHC